MIMKWIFQKPTVLENEKVKKIYRNLFLEMITH